MNLNLENNKLYVHFTLSLIIFLYYPPSVISYLISIFRHFCSQLSVVFKPIVKWQVFSVLCLSLDVGWLLLCLLLECLFFVVLFSRLSQWAFPFSDRVWLMTYSTKRDQKREKYKGKRGKCLNLCAFALCVIGNSLFLTRGYQWCISECDFCM